MILKCIRTVAIAALAFVSVNVSGQDLLARQAPIDRKLKAVDSLALIRQIKAEQAVYPAYSLYPNWNNQRVHAYGNTVQIPDSFRIDLTGFCMPTTHTKITSKCGPRWRRMHNGLDIKVYIGDTIRAAFDGKVRMVKYERRGYGKYVVIRHDNGLETIYGHLSKQIVKEDEYVKAGDPIGLGGNTGRSTGSHLHFETRFLGEVINPEFMFDFPKQDIVADSYLFIRGANRYEYQRTRALAAVKSGKSGAEEAEKSAKAVIDSGKYSLFKLTSLNAAQEQEAEEMDLYIDFAELGIDKDKFIKGMFSYEALWQGANATPANPEYVLTHEYICLKDLVCEIESIITHRAADGDIQWIYEKNKEDIPYPYVYGSSLHLRQIFLNIYGNCIKYNRPGGKITTVMEAADVHDGICTYRWTISDTGIGMSPEFLSHIFDPFSQEKTDARSVYQGTGLGMAITKGLIEQMNGSIEVTSQVGVGSVFVITIPFEIAQEQKKDEEIAEKYDIRGLHLLAAEDNELNAEIIEMLLTDDGAKVTVAKNGRQAVEHFENNPPGTFDAILMDVMMPVMDGIAATKAIRAMDRADAKTIPIIAMTANAFEEDAKRCLAAGMTAHLAKPFQIEDVEKTIVECCGK